jgi:hypothetical protein
MSVYMTGVRRTSDWKNAMVAGRSLRKCEFVKTGNSREHGH